MRGSLQGRPGNPIVPGPGGELYQGFRLRQLRKESGKTLDAVGEAIGITGSALGNIENNRAKPAQATLERLVAFYNVDPTYILNAPIHPQLCREDQPPATVAVAPRRSLLGSGGQPFPTKRTTASTNDEIALTNLIHSISVSVSLSPSQRQAFLSDLRTVLEWLRFKYLGEGDSVE